MSAMAELIGVLSLEPIEVNLFRGISPKEERMRIFGGHDFFPKARVLLG